MPRGEKDQAVNWMVQHHAQAMLRMAGLAPLQSCRAAHARLTLPQAVPDGLLEVTLLGEKKPTPVLLEIEAYPSKETDDQMARDLDLARLALKVLPDAVLVLLSERGQQKQASKRHERSRLGWSRHSVAWKVVWLSRIKAAELLALGEVGLSPLLPLTSSPLSTAALVQQSKEQIEQNARSSEKGALLTITAILAAMREHHVEHWLSLLGGQKVVEHSPLYQSWKAEHYREATQASIEGFLVARFKSVPDEVGTAIRAVTDADKLQEVIALAAKCVSVKQFLSRLAKL